MGIPDCRDIRIEELEAEIKILINTAVQFAVDAERYRFIRHYLVSVIDVDGDGDYVLIVNNEEFDELDKAIDAAKGGNDG